MRFYLNPSAVANTKFVNFRDSERRRYRFSPMHNRFFRNWTKSFYHISQYQKRLYLKIMVLNFHIKCENQLSQNSTKHVTEFFYIEEPLCRDEILINFSFQFRAIGVRRTGSKSINTGAINVEFIDMNDGGKIVEDKKERQFLYNDYSGNITGTPGAVIIRNYSHLLSNSCTPRPEWGPVEVCPHDYVSVQMGGPHNK